MRTAEVTSLVRTELLRSVMLRLSADRRSETVDKIELKSQSRPFKLVDGRSIRKTAGVLRRARLASAAEVSPVLRTLVAEVTPFRIMSPAVLVPSRRSETEAERGLVTKDQRLDMRCEVEVRAGVRSR